MLLVQEAHHSIFVHEQDRVVRDRGRTPHADRLACQASFAKELAWAQDRDDGLSASL